MRLIKVSLALLLLASTAAFAQFGAYAGYTTSKLDLANTNRVNGGTFGAFYDAIHSPVASVGADVRIVILPSDTITHVNSFTFGPRVAIHLPHIFVSPYGEILVGGANVRTGEGIAAYNDGGFAASAVAGADLRVTTHLDWRIIDYSFTRLDGPHTYQNSFTTGLVARF